MHQDRALASTTAGMSTEQEIKGWFLSGPEMLAIRRREYHYNAWSDTLLDPWLQPFWRLVVSYVPTYVTPSTLSMCGLVCNIISTCVTIAFAPSLTETLPPWVSVLNAISIFMYQTFDGIDGKQCFRTQNCELEEYADHAVDSISIMLNAILLTAALQLGDSSLLLGMNFALALSAFYAAHWAANRTHSLVFGHIDVSEAQLSMIAIHIATAVAGPDLWKKPIYGNILNLRTVVCVASAATLLYGTFGNTMIVLGLKKTPLESHEIDIPRRPFSLRPLMSYGVIMSGFVLCITSGLLVEFPVPVMLIVGLSLGRAATGLILQKLITKEEIGLNSSILFPLAARVLRSYCGNNNKELLKVSIWTLVVAVIIIVMIFHAHATSDLKQARNVGVFLMRKGPGEKYPSDSGFYVCGGNLRSVQKAWKEFAKGEERVRATYLTSASVQA